MSWIRIIGINLLLMLVIIFFVEIALGKWGDDDVPNMEYQIFNKTYVDRSELNIKPEIIVIHPQLNGFRFSSSVDFEKNKDCLIITMGGSTTQEYILSQNETWSQRLQDSLNINDSAEDNCDSRYIVMNAGISGHGIIDNFWLLKNYIYNAKLNPVAIIVYQGINDWHTNLNTNSPMIPLRIAKYEIMKYFQYRSFIIGTIRKVINYYSGDLGNRPVDTKDVDDGLLFKVSRPSKDSADFLYENLDNDLIKGFDKWGGVQYHKEVIQKTINFVQEFLPESRLVFITQTQSICDLTDFPNVLGHRKSDNDSITSPNYFTANEWLSSRGTCFRLGIIKSNYVSAAIENTSIEVIDYAGKFVEQSNESYDNYHKTPYGSKLFFDRVENELLHALEKGN